MPENTWQCVFCGMPACDCPVGLYRAFVAAWDAAVNHEDEHVFTTMAHHERLWRQLTDARAALDDTTTTPEAGE